MLYKLVLILTTCFVLYTNTTLGQDKNWCDNSQNNTYPQRNNECYMQVTPDDKMKFAHNIIKSGYKLNFWTFSLQFVNTDRSKRYSNKTDCVFQPLNWVWTYPGQNGAVERLAWPFSFRTWSLGILAVDSDHLKDQFQIIVNGACPITIGEPNTTGQIALALIDMVNNSLLIKEKHSEIKDSYFCYMEQIWIKNVKIYHLCLHIVCPINVIGRKCCHMKYDHATSRRRFFCKAKPIVYDAIWWQYPFIIGYLMFAYFPLILLRIILRFSLNSKINNSNYGSIRQNLFPFEDNQNGWLISNPVSVWEVFKRPIVNCYIRRRFTYSKILKLLIVWMSLSIIFVEILVSYIYEYDKVIEGCKQGIPMNFLTVLVGFKHCRHVFLYYFGGPYIALTVYIISLSLMLTIPRRFSRIIDNGIVDNTRLSVSLLTLDLKTTGKLGGIYNLQYQKGYKKFYGLLKAQIFILINPTAWCLGLKLQFQRFYGVMNMSRQKAPVNCIGVILTVPLYVVLCILEWVVVIVYFSIPIFSFFVVIIRGFWNSLREHRNCSYFLRTLLLPFIGFVTAYNIYIFCIVFVESFLFISRIFIFTLTGLIVYPNETYVYLVLCITITMYIVENIHSVRTVYDDIFERIKAICRRLTHEESYSKVCLLSKPSGGFVFLSEEVFYYVIKRYKPIRIAVCFSALNLMLMTGVIYLAISIIVSLKSFQDMESLTQVCTVLFICLIPKLLTRIFHRRNKLELLKEHAKIAALIDNYSKQKLWSRRKDGTDVNPGNYNESTRLLTPLAELHDSSDDELLYDHM